jgi:uncharacterized protein (TIGR02391 family)
MPLRFSQLIPNVGDLLALEVEELAGVLLVQLSSCWPRSGDSVVQNGLASLHNFARNLESYPEYAARQSEVNQALLEAWNWLTREGFLVQAATQSGWFFLSRRAQGLKSQADFNAYRKANLLPKGQLHPVVASKVYAAFLRGEYDTAVFQAFREIEVAVRRAGGFPDDLVGTKLMREAFRSSPAGPLTDTSLPLAEQEAMSNLFAGAIGLYKNPQSHRNVPTDAIDGAEVIIFASQLLRIIDRRSTSP